MKYTFNNIQKICLIILLTSSVYFAKGNVGIGTDFVSRYVWRGLDFGNSPSIQPTLNYTNGGFEVGAWGAYQLGRDASSIPTDEIDFYLGHTFNFGSTSLSLVATDYYFPNGNFKLGDFDDDGNGAHTIEVGATYTLPESIPLYLAAYVNVYNEIDNSIYFELGYSTTAKETAIDLFVGATPGGTNMYYNTENFSVINVGVTVAKEIKINSDFSLPVFGSLIINPNQDIAYFVFGISI